MSEWFEPAAEPEPLTPEPAVVAVNHPEVGSLGNLLTHESVRPLLKLIPDTTDPNLFVGIFVMPLAVYWWALWYPGSEPGGGAYVAQRILSARNERNCWPKPFVLFNIYGCGNNYRPIKPINCRGIRFAWKPSPPWNDVISKRPFC